MTEKEALRIVNLDICEKYDENNQPPYYEQILEKDVLVIFGESGGILVYPDYSNEFIYRRVVKYDGNYWAECDGPEGKSALGIWDEYKILEVAMLFIQAHSSIVIYHPETKQPVEFRGPWSFTKQTYGKY